MDRQLAERMVGAACLLAVLVLVVPAVLDGNPDSGSTVTHPVVEDPLDLRTHTIRLDGAAREPPVPLPVPAAGESGPAVVAAAASPAPELQPDPADVASPSASAPSESAPSATEDPPTGPEPEPKAKPGPEPEAQPGAGDWLVQLGSFSSRDNAERLAGEVRRQGFPVSVQGGGGSSGRLFRVRAGPRGDKAAAEALARELAAAGFSGGRVGRK